MGGSSGSGRTTTTNNPWPGVQPYLNGNQGIFPEAQRLYASRAPTFAGPTGNELAGRQQQLQYANQIPGMLGDYQQAAQFGLNAPDVANNPIVQAQMDAVMQPFEQQYSMGIRPGIGRNYVGTGDGSTSTREGVEGGVARGLTNQAQMMARADVMNNAYARGLGAQASAMSMYPQVLQQGLMPGQIQQGIGQQQRADIQGQYNEPYDQLQRYAGIIQPGSGIGGQTIGPGAPGSNRVAGAIGGGLAGAGLASGLMSAGAMNSWNPYGWALMGLGALGGAYA